MTQNHNLAPPAGVGGASAPAWGVYPFRLALNISEREFHRNRARIRLKHGKNALGLVSEAMSEERLFNERSEQERAKDAKWLADTWNMPEKDRAILGI